MPLLDLLRSTAFQGAISLLSILLALLPLARTRAKRLSYQIVRNADLFEPGHTGEAHYALTLHGQPVAGLALVVVTLRNTGSRPIRKADFEDPLQFRFPADAAVLSTRVLSTAPSTLSPHLTHTPTTVTLDPLLLKSRESLSLEVLLSKRPNTIQVIDRMAEVTVRALSQEPDATAIAYYWIAALTWGFPLFLWGMFTAGYTLAHTTHHPYSLRHTLPFLFIMSAIPLPSVFFLHRRS